MKKNLLAAALLIGFGFSGASFGQQATAFEGNQEVTGGVGNDCALLAEDVTLGVSANVWGAYLCDETENLVQVGACHVGGSRAQGAACIDLDTETDGDQLPPGCDAIGGFSNIPDYKAFFTSSEGGVMQEHSLGGRCDDSSLTGLDAWGS